MYILMATWNPRQPKRAMIAASCFTILCDCGKQFVAQADRWKITCPHCGRSSQAAALKLLASCKELLDYVEEERGWKGEPDAEPMVMEARAAISEVEGGRA